MSLVEEVRKFSKPVSSVRHSHKTVRKVDRAYCTELNSSIKVKIEQNKEERKASSKDASNFIVR